MLASRPRCLGDAYAPARIHRAARRVRRWLGRSPPRRSPAKCRALASWCWAISIPTMFFKEFHEGLRELGYVEGQYDRVRVSLGGRRSPRGSATARRRAGRPQGRHHRRVSRRPPSRRPSRRPLKSRSSWASRRSGRHAASSPAWRGRAATSPGCHGASAELGGKNLELVREVLPSTRRVAVLANVPDPFHKPFSKTLQASGRTLGIEIKPILLRGAEEIDAGFRRDGKAWRAEAVIVQPSLPHRRFVDMALKHRLPAIRAQYGFFSGRRPDVLFRGPIGARIASPQPSSTRSSRAASLPICRFSFRPSSTWSSTSRPRTRSASRCRRRCSPAPTR